MTFQEAHDLMDLLLDKADQPYFTTEEKDKFLNIALFSWLKKAANKYGADPEIDTALGRLVRTESIYFWNSGRIRSSNVAVGPHQRSSDTFYTTEGAFHGQRIGTAFPIFRPLDIQVQYYNLDTGSFEAPVIVQAAKSNEITTQHFSDGEHVISGLESRSKDPFNKETYKYPKWYYEAFNIAILPISDGPRKLIGWSDDDSTATGSDELGNTSKAEIRYIMYPLASNVAGGDMDESISVSSDSWGTSDIHLGSASLLKTWNAADGVIEHVQQRTREGFPHEICNEIIQNAIRLMGSNIESPAYQTQAIESEQGRSI